MTRAAHESQTGVHGEEDVSIPDGSGLSAVTTEHLAPMREGQDVVGAVISMNKLDSRNGQYLEFL